MKRPDFLRSAIPIVSGGGAGVLYQSPMYVRCSMGMVPSPREGGTTMKITQGLGRFALVSLALAMFSAPVFGHGNVTPTPFSTGDLPDQGKEWKTANPFTGNAKAIEIGKEGYKENCAACHGLEMESGGMAPDLHGLPKGKEGDDLFVDLVTNGVTRNGVEKMPKYVDVVGQTGLWAIRAYIEANHQD